jgi:hypothetical protein
MASPRILLPGLMLDGVFAALPIGTGLTARLLVEPRLLDLKMRPCAASPNAKI